MEHDAYWSVCQELEVPHQHQHNADMSISGLFISGSDTEIGKTFVGSQLVSKLIQSGRIINPRKPIESGCEQLNGQLLPADATAYFHAANQTIALDTINPYRFKAALSPPRAANMENRRIHLQDLVQACEQATGLTIVEGAGGLMSPIAEDGLNIDLAQRLGLPLLLVTEDRLGALNQAMMMIRCAEYAGLDIAAVYLNDRGQAVGDNASDLKKLSTYPVFTTLDHLIEHLASAID